MINSGDKVTVRFPSGQIVQDVEVVATDYLGTWIVVDLQGRHDQIKIAWLIGENRGVKCGNHSCVAYHCTIAEVKACYAPHFSHRQIHQAGTVRGWWDLPIAASMWSADANLIER
jgi:hypothetical protein